MGISVMNATALVREHRYKPIAGDVFMIGRQTMFFSPETAIAIMKQVGVPTTAAPEDLPFEDKTTHSSGQRYVTAEAFFGLLGIHHPRSLDHSNYEGADVIHDLTQPLPKELEGIADFIIDGSTLDNLWNPALALQSLSRMLKPGGRILSMNHGSNGQWAYTVITPCWAFDYLTVNHFQDFRVYVQALRYDGCDNVFAVDHNAVTEDGRIISDFASRFTLGIVVIAERGVDTTTDRAPIQQLYQSPEQRRQFYQSLGAVRRSARPDIYFSNAAKFLPTPHGYRFIPALGQAREPSELREWWLWISDRIAARL